MLGSLLKYSGSYKLLLLCIVAAKVLRNPYYLVTDFTLQKASLERNVRYYCLFVYVLQVYFTHLVILGYHCLVFDMFVPEKMIARKKKKHYCCYYYYHF